jgi:hypothetical protein
MNPLLALLALIAQDAPAPLQEEPVEEEVVVRATLGHTVMLFDKGSDGRLRNCRVMVSSGSERRDLEACQATPVCYAKTADAVSGCVDLVVLENRAPLPHPSSESKPAVFDVPQLVKPRSEASPNAIGPSDPGESRESERQRVKLPPLPRPPADEPVVRVTTGRAE